MTLAVSTTATSGIFKHYGNLASTIRFWRNTPTIMLINLVLIRKRFGFKGTSAFNITTDYGQKQHRCRLNVSDGVYTPSRVHNIIINNRSPSMIFYGGLLRESAKRPLIAIKLPGVKTKSALNSQLLQSALLEPDRSTKAIVNEIEALSP